MLQLPFMQRALLAGLVLGLLLSRLGIYVTLRRMAFFSDGVAHAALAGAAVGLLLNRDPLVAALLFSSLLALLIYYLEKKSRLPVDSIIGIMFTGGMALGVTLISLRQGYQPELIGYLFGNILAIRPRDLALIAVLGAAILAFLSRRRRQLTLLALDRELACLAGIRPGLYEPALYVMLACSLVLGIRVLGIVLVSAILIIPVSTARLFSRSFKALGVWTVVIAEVTVLAGLLLSFSLDLPAGATIVLTGAALFFLVFFLRALLNNK